MDNERPRDSASELGRATNTEGTTLGSRIAKGGAWMVIGRFAVRGLGFVSTIVLARLLMPQDFGLVALATTFVAMLEIFSQFGFDMALIKDQHAGRSKYDTVWTLTIIKGAVIATLVVAVAVPAAIFFEMPKARDVLFALAFASLLEGFFNVGTVNFRKDLEFAKEFRFLLTPKIVSFTITIAAAIILRSHWALVAGILSSRIAQLTLSYTMHPYRPAWTLIAWKTILRFSKWLLVANVMNFFNQRSGTLIIARTLTSQSLGFYNVALEIANLPTSAIVWPVMRAVYPGLAKISHNRQALGSLFLEIVSIAGMFGLPLAMGILLTADLFVPLLLGDQWQPIIPLVEVLAIYGALRSLGTLTGSVILALGRPEILPILGFFFLMILLPALIFSVPRFGAIGAAYSLVLTSAVALVVNYVTVSHLLGLKLRQIANVLWRPFFANIGMLLLVAIFQYWWRGARISSAPAVELVVVVLIGGLSFVTLVLGIWYAAGKPSGVEQKIMRFIRQRASVVFEPQHRRR